MFDYDEFMDKVSQKLKEMYGDDFEFEEGDEFVFSLKKLLALHSVGRRPLKN